MIAVDREVFGTVLQVARFKALDLDRVIADVNGSGFGLTFGIHSRIDDRVEVVTAALLVGNIHVNRNQIGAIVGSQPFGGEGMSGTGPKACGSNYVKRCTLATARRLSAQPGAVADVAAVEAAQDQASIAQGHGCRAVTVVPGAVGPLAVDGVLDRAALTELAGFDGVALSAAEDDLRAVRRALAARDGTILPLMAEGDMADRCVVERHVCIDTTAAGGNARLLAAAG